MLIGEAVVILSDTDGTAASVFPPFCSGGAAGALSVSGGFVRRMLC